VCVVCVCACVCLCVFVCELASRPPTGSGEAVESSINLRSLIFVRTIFPFFTCMYYFIFHLSYVYILCDPSYM
jgi:hypothetical protein